MSFFPGMITALVTPFQNGRVDFKSLERLLRHQLDHGAEGFVVAGTTGESPNLTDDERERLLRKTRAFVSGQVPVLLGTGSNSTAQSVIWTKQAEKWGADGALLVSPYYNKPPQRGLVAHFTAIANETSLPLLLYNVPGRTASEMGVEAIVELSRHPQIKGIKEASGNLQTVKTLKARVPADFSLISGDDGTCLDFMRLGGVGVISVLSHVIPRQLRKMCDQARALEPTPEFAKFVKLTDLLFVEANPIPVKAALHLMGLLDTDEMRLPLVRLAPELNGQLKRELVETGVLA